MSYFRYIFVVLVYKNIDIVKDFFQSFNISNSKVILVNAFYDIKSERDCEELAKEKNAIFLPIKNIGYGGGNLEGINYARKHFKYDFLIISNSDIVVRNFQGLDVFQGREAIIAPNVIMRDIKKQNPDTPIELPFIYYPTFIALNKGKRWLYRATHIITRLSRELFFLYEKIIRKESYRIFAPHGSFVIFTYKAVEKTYPMFDNRMFLYNEEWYLGKRAKLLGVPIYYFPQIEILHLEGGSSSSSIMQSFEYIRDSFNVFYHWNKYGI